MFWFAVENNSGGKHIQVWRRTYGIDPQTKQIFVPAAMGETSTEDMVAIFARGCGERVIDQDQHLFVPLEWLRDNYPKNQDLMNIIEAHVHQKHTDFFPILATEPAAKEANEAD
ncbi:hypothetical protein YA0089_24905 [Pseudomonas viridiflava]|uniref:hypothetical protein n=1 Tax=Pseudomonas viridiflava TaxID=33069 RepID=UPI0018E61C5B|nr:hypothetical protein [Pseudomonas viridiflava]MBI6726855.1 hypothetical protein [Pseudomonas viridiflava]